jgi:pimeloyl-ACP methyl ester carboxylesterase
LDEETIMKRLLATCAFLCLFAANAWTETVHLLHHNTTLRGHLTIAEGASLQDGVVLMTHGTLAHGQMEIMRTVQGLLAERGLNSLTITLSLGQNDRQGMYDCATPHRHEYLDALKEIGAWVDWLRAKEVPRIILAGHSLGGGQTARFALETELPPEVKGLVLIAPAKWSEEKVYSSYQENSGKDLTQLVSQAEDLVLAGKGTEMWENTDFLYCPGATVSAATFYSYYRVDALRDTPTMLPTIETPTLVVIGSDDQVVAGLEDDIAPYVNDTRRMVVIDGAEHFFRDFFAEDLANHMQEFVENL